MMVIKKEGNFSKDDSKKKSFSPKQLNVVTQQEMSIISFFLLPSVYGWRDGRTDGWVVEDIKAGEMIQICNCSGDNQAKYSRSYYPAQLQICFLSIQLRKSMSCFKYHSKHHTHNHIIIHMEQFNFLI